MNHLQIIPSPQEQSRVTRQCKKVLVKSGRLGSQGYECGEVSCKHAEFFSLLITVEHRQSTDHLNYIVTSIALWNLFSLKEAVYMKGNQE